MVVAQLSSTKPPGFKIFKHCLLKHQTILFILILLKQLLKGTIITINSELRDLNMSHAISDG